MLVSSGDDNGFGTAFAGDEDKYLAYEKLTVELLKKNIRVLPIGFDAASSQLAWVDGGVSQKTTDYRALDTPAVYGGTGLKGALAADSTEGLAEAIRTVSRAVRSCRFRVPDDVLAAGTDGFRLEARVTRRGVPSRRFCIDGKLLEAELGVSAHHAERPVAGLRSSVAGERACRYRGR